MLCCYSENKVSHMAGAAEPAWPSDVEIVKGARAGLMGQGRIPQKLGLTIYTFSYTLPHFVFINILK